MTLTLHPVKSWQDDRTQPGDELPLRASLVNARAVFRSFNQGSDLRRFSLHPFTGMLLVGVPLVMVSVALVLSAGTVAILGFTVAVLGLTMDVALVLYLGVGAGLGGATVLVLAAVPPAVAGAVCILPAVVAQVLGMPRPYWPYTPFRGWDEDRLAEAEGAQRGEPGWRGWPPCVGKAVTGP